VDATTWDRIAADLPGAHILQTWEWGQIKQAYGWQPLPYTWQDRQGKTGAAALVLQRKIFMRGISMPLSVLYVPRGPLVDWNNPAWREQVLAELEALARLPGVIFIKIDPEVVIGYGIPGTSECAETPIGHVVESELTGRGWRYSSEQIQFKNTVWVNLSCSESELLGRMKQKTRYNLNLAQRKGVVVRIGNITDLDVLYRLYAETSVRDGFVIRPEHYYKSIWQSFMEKGMARALLAEVDGMPVAGLFLFYFARRAWYLYGMSNQAHRDKMPNYLLQWTAMQQAKQLDCVNYDLWGAPDLFNDTDSLWGVYRFKEGLGGRVVRTTGAWDFTSRPWLYESYTRLLPLILTILRRRGKERTRREVSL
jgi:peptidoglycan pentaglycine glycine transferase (the first glycine)